MPDHSFLDWPFFDDHHRQLARETDEWAASEVASAVGDHQDVDGACKKLVSGLGACGLLQLTVPKPYGGRHNRLDVRSLCLVRDILARHDGLADFAFAMQGLGSGPISLFGTEDQKDRLLPQVARGDAIAAFALTEPETGSDAAAIATTATPDGSDFVLNGQKTWISNGGIADQYVVFARTGEAPGARGLSAFVVRSDAKGFAVSERIDAIAPHPLGTLTFTDCRIPKANLIGQPGEGFKIAMATLDVFRTSVGAAALGFARRALDEALDRASSRKIFGEPLIDLQMTQSKIADMATSIDAAALLIHRAAWMKDQGAERITRQAAMAKMFATEEAQLVIDQAVQLHGGDGVRSGATVERLYRDIRALRIYEGATEVQKLIIARETQKAHGGTKP